MKPKGAMEKPWLLAISTVKALMHTQGFYWERDTGFRVASNILTAQGSWDLLRQVQERKGCYTGPLAGSRVEIKVNALGIVELTAWRVQLPAINTIREVTFTHPGLHLGTAEGSI